ncbi:MAG: glycosyltransferase, partial [Cyanobacteria bacterium CAN_BIN43]|nr:glycosyltransferase [Cyanobacteria bacterium CAN_BIN43]
MSKKVMPRSLPSLLSQTTVMGLPVHLQPDYVDWLVSQLQQQKGVHIVTLNAEMAMQAEKNEALATV